MKSSKSLWTDEERAEIQKMCDAVVETGSVWLKTQPDDIRAGFHFQYQTEVHAADPDMGITIIYNNWGHDHKRPAVCLYNKLYSGGETFRWFLRRILESCLDGNLDPERISRERNRTPSRQRDLSCAFME